MTPIRIGIIGATVQGLGNRRPSPALAALEEFEVTAVSTTHLATAKATAEAFANGDIGQPLTVSVVSAGGPAGRQTPQATSTPPTWPPGTSVHDRAAEGRGTSS